MHKFTTAKSWKFCHGKALYHQNLKFADLWQCFYCIYLFFVETSICLSHILTMSTMFSRYAIHFVFIYVYLCSLVQRRQLSHLI